MTARPIIEAEGLHTYYGASHILHGINLSVRRGEAIGLMGRNGMGKTTLIRTLVGHITPRHGAIKINGRDLTGAAPYVVAREGIAYVPEGRGIFPNLTVRENLIMMGRPGPNGQCDWTYERVLQTFPRLAERLIAQEIWRIIRTIRESGIAAIIVDKNFGAVSALTDRNLILVKGRVVFEGTGSELRNQPELLQQHLGI